MAYKNGQEKKNSFQSGHKCLYVPNTLRMTASLEADILVNNISLYKHFIGVMK